MSQTVKDPQEMSDDELLEYIASFDEEEYPVARHAERGLTAQDEEESS